MKRFKNAPDSAHSEGLWPDESSRDAASNAPDAPVALDASGAPDGTDGFFPSDAPAQDGCEGTGALPPDFAYMADLIRLSRERSKAYGVDPNLDGSPEHLRLDEVALERRIEERQDYFDSARGQLDCLYGLLRGTGFCMTVTDEEGYILYVTGDPDFIEHFKRRRCLPGYRWTERDMGTCAIGLALAETMPVFIPGPCMYCREVVGMSNAAAPIFSPDGKKVLGVVSLSGSYERMHIHTLGIVRQAAETITSQLKEIERYRDLQVKNEYLRALIESDARGVVAVDASGRIVESNESARRLLRLPRDCRGELLRDFVDGLAEDFADGHVREAAEDAAGAPGSVPGKVQGHRAARHPAGRAADGEADREGDREADREVDREVVVRGAGTTCYIARSPIRTARGEPIGALVTVIERKKLNRTAVQLVGNQACFTFESILGTSGPIKEALRLAKIASQSSAAVFLYGETGTGKELFAQALHNAGARAQRPFVVINCGAVPRELLESELFGYEEGAFTGAQKGGRPGKIELADTGTLFLDEIGDMPLDMQVKLLRVLQSGEIQRVGGLRAIPADFRVIAATNKDLPKAIEAGEFRADLFYRISTLAIRVPSLRERGEDIALLAEHFAHRHELFLGRRVLPFPKRTMEALLAFSWPGNVRQLENAVERAVHFSEGGPLLPRHFGLPMGALEFEAGTGAPHASQIAGEQAAASDAAFSRIYSDDASSVPGDHAASPNPMDGTFALGSVESPDASSNPVQSLAEVERRTVEQALAVFSGNLSRAARALGISRPRLYRKLRQYGLR